jgi:putative Holliday junction resolvase
MDIRIPRPLVTLPFRHEIFEDVAQLVAEHEATAVIVGWPRGLEGQTTAQTTLVEDFVAELRKVVPVPIHLQDEALTSHQAEAELRERKETFEKSEVDSLAATYILEDYLASVALLEQPLQEPTEPPYV